SPLLGKGGDAAPSSKWSRSFGGAARSVSPVGRNIKNGVVRSTSDNRWLEPTILPCFALSGSHSLRSCPSAPAKEASRHFLNGRSHPSLSKEGTAAFPPVVFNAPVSSKKMWDMARHHCKEGWPSDSENIAKHPLIARPGWFSDESKRKTTPAASASVASPNFL